MANKCALEQEVKAMKKHFGGLLALVKDLKAEVENVKKKLEPNKNPEVKKIIEKQKLLNELIVANTESIKKIESEMKEIQKKGNVIPPIIEKEVDEAKNVAGSNLAIKKCRYFDKGYCKYAKKCRYLHPKEICKTHIENMKCKVKECSRRHPKACKWYQREVGCTRLNCEYLHFTLAETENVTKAESKDYECAGCKNVWQDENCVIKQNIENTEGFFCLNCDDWIINKSEVLKSNWTLFDLHGHLRQDV